MSRLLRYLARDASPAFRFDAVALQPAGNCSVISDAVETSRLPAGRYSYHLRWPDAPPTARSEVTTSFEIPDLGAALPAAEAR